MKKFFNKSNVIIMLCVCLIAGSMFLIGRDSVEPIEKEVVKYVEVMPNLPFDTSVLEHWDGDFSSGKIRMVGAWYYGTDRNGNPIVIDELNELWTLTGYEINDGDFLLLWVADSNTENYVHDDIVIKIWVEKYEKFVEVG